MEKNRLEIRSFTESDYEDIVKVHNTVYPEYKISVEELKRWDEKREDKIIFNRYVCEKNGEIVAEGVHNQSSHFYHPQKFWAEIVVLPEYRKQGVGSALYRYIMDVLEEHDPITIRGEAREDNQEGIKFIEHRGFKEDRRNWESHLYLDQFDAGEYDDLLKKVSERGIEIKTLKELKSDPDRDRKLHRLHNILLGDIPSSEEHTDVDLDEFKKSIYDNPNLIPEAYLIAVHKGGYVGETNLWKNQEADYWDTGLTGVIKEYRGMAIATALKVKSLKYAKENGCPYTKTWNDSTNEGMLHINEKLGFEKKPAWISFVKEIKK